MKVVINRGYGELELSNEAIRFYADMAGIELFYTDDPSDKFYGRHLLVPFAEFETLLEQAHKTKDFTECNTVRFDTSTIERTDPILIHVIEELKERANTLQSEITVVEIPDKVKFKIVINEDGAEEIHEDHRVWK